MHTSLASMFADRVNRSKSEVAVRFKEGKSAYQNMSWDDFGRLVNELSYGLAALGLEPRRRAAIIANTSHLWLAADQAILSAGAASVPIYPTSAGTDIEHILHNSESEILFVQSEKLLKKIFALQNLPASLHKIVLMTPSAKAVESDKVITLDQLQELGRNFKSVHPKLIDERIKALQAEDLATIIYTSGTTGTPKGVMLTHHNVLSVVYDIRDIINVTEDDERLAFLPLSHVFERVCGEFFGIHVGWVTSFAEGLEHMPKNMAEIQPSIMLVVPRLLDKIYAKVRTNLESAGESKRKLVEWALNVGNEYLAARAQGTRIGLGLQARHLLAEKLVFSKLRDKINPRLRLVITGGAPATADVIRFFNAIGITVMEGYGLTETAAPTHVNRMDRIKVGTVGPNIPSIQVRVGHDGEILLKGPSIFKGYFKAPELTEEAFTEDGWFHTGDIGEVDRDGYLRITDRKKDLIVNASGKNIAPQKIETALRNIPVISQAVVFGDKRKTLVALLTLDEQAAVEAARDHGWKFDDFEDLTKLPQMRKHLKSELSQKMSDFADYEQVRNFAVLPHEFSVDDGEMTATLKIRRNVLKERYAPVIDSLYTGSETLAGVR
jgi:long-chain acyl-CoA synthetase